MLVPTMSHALLLLAAMVGLLFWHPHGPDWLQAMPLWSLQALVALLALYAAHRVGRRIRGAVRDLSD